MEIKITSPTPVTVEVDGRVVVAPIPPPSQPPPTEEVYTRLDTSYFDSATLREAVEQVDPPFAVYCDGELLKPADPGNTQPPLRYGSTATGTIVVMNPEHPYFTEV